MAKSIPTKFFDMLPLPVIISEMAEDTLNHTIIYVNESFTKTIGWSLADIPDKNHWWQKAYPDPHYQKVVEQLWEMSMETLDPIQNDFVMVTVNINTKYEGTKRFNVFTELNSALLEGYYVVAFEEVPFQEA